MHRRKFLKSASAAALLCATPDLAKAWIHGGGSAFNNGKTQIQSTIPNSSGDFPFINLVKVGDNWRGTGTDNGGAVLDPSWLDTNGYPIAASLSRDAFGAIMQMSLPSQSSRISNAASPMVLTWTSTLGAVVRIGNAPLTTVSVSTTDVLNGYGFSDGLYHGRYVWYPTYDAAGNYSFQLNLQSLATGSSIVLPGIQLFFSADETALLAGNIFGIKYKQVLQQANPGVFRFMDWLATNISNVTTWATRKPMSNPAWSADEFRASLYPGNIMTNSGSAYSLTTGSFTLADKLTMHVHFNVDGTISINTQNGFSISGSPQTLTYALTPALTFTWTSHPLVNTQIVGALFSGNLPTGMQTGVNYYVVNATTNTFQLALTSGGGAIAPASLNSAGIGIVTMATLSLNGSAAYPIRGISGTPLFEAPASVDSGGSAKIYGTVVFDSTLGCWLMSGATKNTFSVGIQNQIPIEVCLQLCKEIGMHPSFSIPYLALDKMTDYVPSLAAYIKASGQPWMIPRFEAGNEVWNNLTPITQYGLAKAWAYWQVGLDDWAGMITSTMGQAVAAVYGHGNLGTTYEVMIGVQTDGMNFPVANPSGLDPRMTSAQYVANGPAQAGYTQTAASGWASAVLPSTYISPASRGTVAEMQLAFDYYVTSVANPTQRAADLNTYVNTLAGTNTAYTIDYETGRWHGTKDWASRFGVSKMFAYEGGYSPDLMPNFYDLRGPFKAAMQSTPESTLPVRGTSTVVTINNAESADRGVSQSAQAGQPCVVGMLVAFDGTGFPFIENNSTTSVSFSSTVPDITWTAHNVHPNEVVQFSGASLPSNITAGTRYFAISTNLTTNTFQVSATRGGAAIQPNTTVSGQGAFSAFVVSGVSGTSVTIDCDSSGAAAPTASMFATYPNSLTYVNDFRVASLLFSTALQTQITASFTAFAGQGGSFPSQYEVSGTNAIWPPIQPDIYGTQGGEFAAIVAFNH